MRPRDESVLGKLLGHMARSEDDGDDDDDVALLEDAQSVAAVRPSTPRLPYLAWDGDAVRPSIARPAAAPSMSPRPQREAILVTEFAFLHASFAPPFPLDPAAAAAEPAPSAAGTSSSEASSLPRTLSFGGQELRRSVRQLVREIQTDTIGPSPTTTATPADDEEEKTSERELHITSSVRNLVLNLRRDCERHSLQPTTVDSSVLARHVSRRRGYSSPVEYHHRGRSTTVTASAPHKVDFLPRLVSNVTTSLRRLSLLKATARAPAIQADAIDGARWKIVELAFRFGGPHRYYLVQAVNMFYPLQKFGRRGYPHPTRLLCHQYGTLQWEHKRGGYSAPVDLALVELLVDGRTTPVFQKQKRVSKRNEACSLSIVFTDRTLDLETSSEDHRDWLSSALRTLVNYAKKQRRAERIVVMEEDTKHQARAFSIL
ncbi:hypothetical protein SPRG_20966 [Saprolegnia parasitica CBS 223.65]|uniref:PH domain-containing protein n=1 Tax=Saprolegnia parasitica (strain CBS 223.65) TaxID=695850 RepID=A0A067BWL1_SAPPC|nr:hypothetical protein SPRG_20966 [Saprolegnia parasitica CBS 223.65]KDO21195.1 hypothetical protein SPRG_20966 [Saprolegnia parasitica CBS 223.65]|eukprot:XP_012208115.1 hypothetical protein SPRG_20966 [Saprolegnia parasitica CBS 223.65]